MSEKKSLHVHKYKKIVYKSGNSVFFCTLPDCTNKINPALALGKRSICWRCGSEFILTEYALRLAKPHCTECHKPKGVIDKIDKIIFDNGSTINISPSNDPYRGEPLTLAERLQATIKQVQSEEEEL